MIYANDKFVSMTMHRARIQVVEDILTTTSNVNEYDGASITQIIRQANISHGRLSRILNNLVSQGLLEQINSKGSFRYKISSSGQEFLSAYRTFRDFSEDFGLTI